MKRTFMLLALLLLVGISAFAQKKITGKVLDEKGRGLPGAGITVGRGLTIGSVTDENGKFELTLPNGINSIQVQSIGYVPQTVKVSGDEVNVNMRPDAKEMQGVIVTALGLKREKRTLGYSAQAVRADQLDKSGSGNTFSELGGKVSGLTVINSAGDPGSGTYIRLRGVNALTGDNQPLVIIDGIPVDNSINNYDPTGSGFQASGSSGNLTGGAQSSNRGLDINPADIDNISVLKGPAATALYGIQAQGGALIITTKKGNDGGSRGAHVSLSSSYSVDQVNKLPELQSKYSQGTNGEYQSPFSGKSGRRLSWGALIDTLSWTHDPTNPLSPGASNDWDIHGAVVGMSDSTALIPVKPYDRYAFFQKGQTFNNSITITNGDNNSSIRVSLANLRQTGIIPHSDFERSTFGFAGQKVINSRLSVSGGLTYSKSFSNKAQQGSNVSGVMLGLLRTPATFDNANGVSDPANNEAAYILADGNQRNYRGGSGYDNPYWTVNRNIFKENIDRIYGFGQATFMINKAMNILYRVGGDAYSQTAKNAYDIHSGAFAPNGAIFITDYLNRQYNSDLMLNIEKDVSSDIHASVLLGHNFFGTEQQTRFSHGSEFVLPNFLDMQNVKSYTSSEGLYRKRTQAFYAQAMFSYQNILYLTLSGRKETTSTLLPGKNKFFYPSASLAFVFTQLPGYNSSTFLPYGKLRISYAQVGQDAKPYSLYNYFSTAAINDGFTSGINWPIAGVSGYQISSSTSVLGNPNLKPYNTSSFETGTDLSFFNNRLGMTFTYYQSRTTNQIFTVPMSSAMGTSAVIKNVGELSNHGVELSLNTTPIRLSSGFRWDVDFNYSKNINKVVSLADGVDQLFIAGFENGAIYAIPGQPFGSIFGSAYLRDAKGNMIINDDVNDPGYGMPIVGTTNKVIGNIQPKWFGSIVNRFSYKNWSLSAQIDIKKGGQIWNGTRGALGYFGTSAETGTRGDTTVFSGVLGHPNAIGDITHFGTGNTELPGAGDVNSIKAVRDQYYWQNIGGSFIGAAEASVEDGSFVRLRQLGLTYELPYSIINKAHFQNFSVTVFMNNIILWTKYKGVDPETSLGGPANGQGLDYFNNPGIKSYGIRLNVGL